MKFTLEELNTIIHSIEVAKKEYEKIVKDTSSTSTLYEIFSRQIFEADRLIEKIKTTEI